MKIRQKPGCDDCMEWDDGLTVHCAPCTEGELMDPVGVQVCINARLPSGSSFAMVLPLKTGEDVKAFTSFITKSFKDYNRRQP